METIRYIIMIACFVGIAISMLDIITPEDKLKKQIRLIFSLVFIITIMSPIVKGKVKFETPDLENIKNSDAYLGVTNTYNNALADYFAVNIENNINEKLKVNDIYTKQVDLVTKTDDQQRIDISEVKVSLENNQRNLEKKATEIIINEIGDVPVKYTYSEVKDEQSNR